MMKVDRQIAALAVSVASLGLGACGGDGGSSSPVGPSGFDEGVTLHGTVLASFGGASSRLVAFSTAADGVTVSVAEEPAIVTEVGPDGTFTLRGLPEGSFTLVFTGADGGFLGEIPFEGVQPNQEITITVDVSDTGVTLVEEQRNGIGHGDIEIQGDIDEVVSVDPAGDSEFVIAGYTVVVRPGQTAIRRGNTALDVDELSAGDQVHVKGVWMDLAGADPADQPVLAHEVKLQQEAEDDDDADGGGSEKITICHKKKKTMTVSVNAWPAHQAHGDTMGACS